MGLTIKEENWGALIERQKEEIVEQVARDLSMQHPELFRGPALSGDFAEFQEVVRRAVLTRRDLTPDEAEEVIHKLAGQASGYGPLQPFFVGPKTLEITEVMCNPSPHGRPRIFYGARGRQHYAGDHFFNDNREVTNYAQKICEDAGRFFGEDSPAVDAWLRDGSRISVFGFKACPLGSAFTIRKSPLIRPALPLEELVKSGMLPPLVQSMIADLLVAGHANFGVFGRTDSGKTTVVRAAGEVFDPGERVMIGEVSFELSFPHLHNCINLVEVGFADQKILTMSQICDLMLRNNPDRGIVGEIRAGEVVAASEIAESTSGGFITTGHAGGVYELRSRMPKMFARGGMDLKHELVDAQVSTMFHFLLFFDKPWDNIRTMLSLVEVQEGGEYREIVRFDEDEFAHSQGAVRRWIYVQPISQPRISRLAFRGARISTEHEQVIEKYHYCPKVPDK